MAKKRTKPDVMVISTHDQAVEAMKEMKELARLITAKHLELDRAIDEAKKQAADATAPVSRRSNELETALSNYAHHNKTELFKKKRSVDTPFGVFGFRKSKELKCLPKFKMAIVLEKLKNFKFNEAIKTKESVDKEAMRDWPPERLESVGLKRVNKDVFYIELNQEDLNEPA